MSKTWLTFVSFILLNLTIPHLFFLFDYCGWQVYFDSCHRNCSLPCQRGKEMLTSRMWCWSCSGSGWWPAAEQRRIWIGSHCGRGGGSRVCVHMVPFRCRVTCIWVIWNSWWSWRCWWSSLSLPTLASVPVSISMFIERANVLLLFRAMEGSAVVNISLDVRKQIKWRRWRFSWSRAGTIVIK